MCNLFISYNLRPNQKMQHDSCEYEDLVIGNVIKCNGTFYRVSRRTAHTVWGRRLARIPRMDIHTFKPWNERTLTIGTFTCFGNNPLSDGQEDRLAKKEYYVYHAENMPYLYFGEGMTLSQEGIDRFQNRGETVPRHLIQSRAAFVNKQTLEPMDRALPNLLHSPRVAVNMSEANEEAERYHARQAFVPEQPPNA